MLRNRTPVETLTVCIALVLAACGGGGDSSQTTPAPVPTPVPNPTPVPTPTPNPTGADMGATKIPLVDLGVNIYNPALQNAGGYQGGLYADGSNTMPTAHHTAGLAKANSIQPLDQDGTPAFSGKIVLLSIGMSNTRQEFCVADHVAMTCGGTTGHVCNTPSGNLWRQNCHATSFMGQAAVTSGLNPNLVIVNGAAGQRTAVIWTSPTAATDSQGNGFDDFSGSGGSIACRNSTKGRHLATNKLLLV